VKNNFVNSVKTKRLVPPLLAWFSRSARDLPWRRSRDPYAIWVSEIMLQQTQVKTVLPYYERWIRALPTIATLAKASPEKIHKVWEGLGYYTRVRNLQKAAQLVVAKHNGRFPEAFADVLALPGIGRYTAGAICSIAFNQPAPILDGNVIRVLTRIFGIEENPREKETNALLWGLAEDLVVYSATQSQKVGPVVLNRSRRVEDNPPYRMSSREHDSCSSLNQSLMELGALVCTPRQPNCPACPVKKFCAAFRQDRTDELPNLVRREKATRRRFTAFVLERSGKFLVRQRPAGVVNAHLWEFPNAELNGAPELSAVARSALGFTPETYQPLCTIKHSITRYRITLEAHRVVPAKQFADDTGRWLTLRELDGLAFTSAHKKIIAALADRG
jgi:A/G-specific adenine glycosylase